MVAEPGDGKGPTLLAKISLNREKFYAPPLIREVGRGYLTWKSVM
jgi:hypothetical protein